jgi:hypothetical protein
MIRDIGLMRKLLAETEYPINGLKLDVAWRAAERKTSSQVWEVQIAGNFYEALAKLQHAWVSGELSHSWSRRRSMKIRLEIC